MKSNAQMWRYQLFGPSLPDALEVLIRERDKVQNCIDALTRCMEAGLLGGSEQKLSARREGLIAMPQLDAGH